MNKKIFLLISVIIIGVVDVWTTSNFRLYIFYLIPLFIATFFYSLRFAIVLCVLSYLFIFYSDYHIDKEYTLLSLWNDMIIFFIFLFFIFITKKIKHSIQLEKENIFLNQSLKMQKFVIREMYHRLKNNMNELIGYVILLEEQKKANALELVKNKLYVYSVLFEKLCYDAEERNKVDLFAFLVELIEIFKNSLSLSIPITLNMFQKEVDYNTSRSIGLILNELMTNSVKYAFDDFSKASIVIRIEEKDNQLILHYSDNGKGFEFSESDVENHLGSFIIHSLVEQFKGTISYNRQNGSHYKITLYL